MGEECFVYRAYDGGKVASFSEALRQLVDLGLETSTVNTVEQA